MDVEVTSCFDSVKMCKKKILYSTIQSVSKKSNRNKPADVKRYFVLYERDGFSRNITNRTNNKKRQQIKECSMLQAPDDFFL